MILKQEECFPNTLIEALQEIKKLKDWKAGAMGAAIIMYPPNEGPHTFAAYREHAIKYHQGSDDYREGADFISDAALAVKKKRG